MMGRYIVVMVVSLMILAAWFGIKEIWQRGISEISVYPAEKQLAATAAIVTSPFNYNFRVDGILQETATMDESSSPYWWLNSGALFYLKDGIGSTIKGELPKYYKWRLLYADGNPTDTDDGYHPQNIFRLVTRSRWQDFRQEAYFRIVELNVSDSQNRNSSNGFLLFSRYQDGDNLYYAGLRVDGAAVIKKKTGGIYYTLAYEPVYSSEAPYKRETNPNLIPGERWIGVRSEIKNIGKEEVEIRLWVDKNQTGQWELAAMTVDDGRSYGGRAIMGEGFAGIRTDFMDVEMDNFKVTSL